jgi:hypothetical protein
MTDVFISYSHDDELFARQLEERLSADGISVWIDYKSIKWGALFPASIEEGLNNATHIICLMSPSWTSSAWSSLERYSAMVDDPNGFLGKLLPILISHDTSVPPFMRPLMYIDCTRSGALDHEYARIRDHILWARLSKQKTSRELPRLLEAGGAHLPELGYVFVVGHPGAGKSTFSRVFQSYGSRHGFSLDKRSDFRYLQALFRLDLARNDRTRFDTDPKSEFKVKDPAVYDEALKLIHDEIVGAPVPSSTLRVIEFSRPHYDSSFLYYTMRALVNSAIVHVKAPLEVCQSRNELRRRSLEKRLAGVEVSSEAFDADPDVHYTPPSVYDRYRRDSEEWGNQDLVLALMPARSYVSIDNSDDDLMAYRSACETIIDRSLKPLIEGPEKLVDFYRRRINALERFVSPTAFGE